MRHYAISCVLALWAAAAPAQDVRSEIEKVYAANRTGFLNKDLAAIMALRAEDFQSVTPDGQTHDRAWLESYIDGLLNGIKEWKELTITVDSITTHGDTAIVIASQQIDRIALRNDQQYHRVQTWVTQREIWIRKEKKWLMWRVDNLRNQRRLVDGVPG